MCFTTRFHKKDKTDMLKMLQKTLLASIVLAGILPMTPSVAQEEDGYEMPMEQMPMGDHSMTGETKEDAKKDTSPMMSRGMMMGPDMMGGCPPMGWAMGMMGHGMKGNQKAIMEGRLAYIKAELNINETQNTAWEAYVATIRTRMKKLQEMHSKIRPGMQTGTAIERLDGRIKNLEERLQTLQALKPVTEVLYKELTDNQKKKADLLLGKGHCMM